MRLLLDTHLLLWALTDDPRLGLAMRSLIEDADNEVLFSAASIWEIAIKAALGRIDFVHRAVAIAQAARDTGLAELPIRASAASRVAELPPHHRDPFDRLLIAQAMDETIRLYTADPILPRYSELVIMVS